MNRVLLLDSSGGLQSLTLALRDFGIHATTVQSVDAASRALVDPQRFDAVVASLGDFTSDDALQGVGHQRIAVVERGSFAEALASIGQRIDDCLLAPPRVEELVLALQRPKSKRRAVANPPETIVGRAGGLAKAWKVLEKAAGFDADVLILGESGTGKELFARALHNKGKQASGPFVAVNCAAIPTGLLESQLFGHVRGAFTDAHQDKLGVFARADGGTLFLDEIGDFPLDLQAKLLRVLQTGEVQPLGSEQTIHVKVRLVSATSRDLDSMVAQRSFRDDLYYRLAVIPILLPPLRERRDDIAALIEHFLQVFAAKHKLEPMALSEDARRVLMQADWPGNVRELQNAVERLVVLSEGLQVDAAFVRREIGRQHSSQSVSPQSVSLRGRPLKEAMREVEARFIAEALAECRGKRARCAELLSISPRALLYKIKEHDL